MSNIDAIRTRVRNVDESLPQAVADRTYLLGLVDETAAAVERLTTALRVASHRPHDYLGDKMEGFPTCSSCGAILTGRRES